MATARRHTPAHRAESQDIGAGPVDVGEAATDTSGGRVFRIPAADADVGDSAEVWLESPTGIATFAPNGIDLVGDNLVIATGDTLVFVEVRQRSSRGFGGAAGSIGFHKQRKLVAAAQFYLGGLARTPACRFDAVLLDAPDHHGATRIEWLKNAFDS